jgi:hypothetical protein
MTPILGIMASSISGSKAITGAYESIASFSPTSGSSVTFTSIPSTYTSLQIRYAIRTTTAGAILTLRPNSTSTSIYAYHELNGNGTTAAAFGFATQTSAEGSGSQIGTDTTNLTVGVIDVHQYASTTQNKTIRVFSGIDNNGTGEVALLSGLYGTTTAISSFQLTVGGTTFLTAGGSTISLYGIKG